MPFKLCCNLYGLKNHQRTSKNVKLVTPAVIQKAATLNFTLRDDQFICETCRTYIYKNKDEGWKLNRTNYYQEGWLATGNVRGIVGVTFTTSHCKRNLDYPLRTNYNLRGHRSDVILVKWNEPYQKLASCDSSGIIFVWIKYEGRWSIELINDRNTPVTHFSWSHDGRMALICYQDGFVLVGSVAGQRYWSSMLNLDATITCGIWTPDDQQVYFGTTQGQIIVMDVHGAMVSQVQLRTDVGITSMSWSCEKFKMEEGEDAEPGVTNAAKRSFVLAVSFQNGYIYLLKSYDDVSPAQIDTGLNGTLGLVMEWSNSRELLAVAGSTHTTPQIPDSRTSTLYENVLKFYTENGTPLYTAKIPNNSLPVSALTWGHNDKRIFIATGNQVHIAWVSRRIASLQLLCRLQIQSCISSESLLPKLPLPSRIKTLIGNLFAQTIRCCVPETKSLREFVSRPPGCSTRLHCTMIRHDDDSNLSSGTCYTLYLEYLGGLVPLLKGKRTSKIRPEFVIFDPQVEAFSMLGLGLNDQNGTKSSSASSHSTNGTNGRSDSSESEIDDGCRGSPRLQRKRKGRSKRKAFHSSPIEKQPAFEGVVSDELAYVDTLPEEVKLVEVTSNIWGTKFKIHGLADTVPSNLGQVTYKTSLLHLQPRQMTLVITELRDDFNTDPDPNFNPNLFSEDEEDQIHILTEHSSTPNGPQRRTIEGAPPIAPMSPRPNRFTSRLKTTPPLMPSPSCTTATNPSVGPLARAESYEDESPQSNVVPRPGPSYCSLVTQYSRSSTSSSAQSRHAISPLCCEGSVPTLQSPKNAVAPSDIIFDRPPACQTTLMSYSSNNDYSNNVVQVKNAIMNSDQHNNMKSMNSHVNPVPLNLNLNLERIETTFKAQSKQNESNKQSVTSKRKDLQFIDEETPTSTFCPTLDTKMRRTPTVVSITPVNLPDSITRSCSAGYLDSVEMVPSDIALSMLRKDAPNKRLVLVDKKPQRRNKRNNNNDEEYRKTKLKQSGKSKSLDSCDLLSVTTDIVASNNQKSVMPKVNETSETDFDLIFRYDIVDTNNIEVGVVKLNNDFDTHLFDLENKSRHNLKNKRSGNKDTKKNNKTNNNDLPNAKVKIVGATNPVTLTTTTPTNSLTLKSLTTSTTSRNHNEKLCPVCKKSTIVGSPAHSLCVFCRRNQMCKKLDVTIESKPSLSSPSSPSKFYQPVLIHKDPFRGLNKDNNISSVEYSHGETSSSYLNHYRDINRNTISDNKRLANNNLNLTNNNIPIKKKTEVITSYTDSPLFSRKYRYQNETRSPNLGRKSELVSLEGNKKKLEKNGTCLNLDDEIDGIHQMVEITPVEPRTSVSLHTQALTTLENIISRLRDLDEGRLTPPSSPQAQRHPRSSPASPAPSKKGKRNQSASPIRHLLNSPLLNRRQRKKQPTESSDDENQSSLNGSGEELNSNGKQYRDLETFQKAQLRQKLKRGKIEPNGVPSTSQPAPLRREFVMHNKAPMWNENSQVYQLDFGGRVTQESAKNFQIEFRGKQVMQFGRIDGNAYTLDFQYPFSALQAFAVALANVTQRLK